MCQVDEYSVTKKPSIKRLVEMIITCMREAANSVVDGAKRKYISR